MEVKCVCLSLSGVYFVWDCSLRLCRLWSTINSIPVQFIMLSLKLGFFSRTINFSCNEKSVGSWKTMIDTAKHLAIFHSLHYDNIKDLENSNCYKWSIFEQQQKKKNSFWINLTFYSKVLKIFMYLNRKASSKDVGTSNSLFCFRAVT